MDYLGVLFNILKLLLQEPVTFVLNLWHLLILAFDLLL